MPKLRVHAFSISLDGYGAGPGQDLKNPLGVGGEALDELHLAITPVLLGKGEHLLGGIDTVALGYRCTEFVATPKATHFVLTKG